jgi:hypothetical protein
MHMQADPGKMAASLLYLYTTEPDDDLQCSICLDVAKDPVQHEECGKLFCKECIDRRGKDNPCPNCNTRKSKFYQDKISKKCMGAIIRLAESI